MPNPRVFVTNLAGHDYENAAKYGEIEWIIKGYINFGALDRVKYEVTEKIKSSKPEDWLLLSGTSVICVIAAVVWFSMHKKVKLLVWDKKSEKFKGSYQELILTVDNIDQLLAAIQDGR